MSLVVSLKKQQWRFLKSHFELACFLFLFYLFGITKMINKFVIPSRLDPSKTIPDLKPKWTESTYSEPKRRQNPTLLGSTYLYGLYRGVHNISHLFSFFSYNILIIIFLSLVCKTVLAVRLSIPYSPRKKADFHWCNYGLPCRKPVFAQQNQFRLISNSQLFELWLYLHELALDQTRIFTLLIKVFSSSILVGDKSSIDDQSHCQHFLIISS